MFAALHSVVKNTNNLDKLFMNFIIPYNSTKKFSELIEKYNETIQEVNYSSVYIHENLINKELNKKKLNLMRPWKITLKEYLKNSYSLYL